MILVVVALAGVLTVPLAGGQLGRLAHVPLHHAWAVWASAALQVAITGGAGVPAAAAITLHLSSYVLSAGCIWWNRRLPGAWLLAAGAAANLSAIVTNGGSMPATAWAWRTSGLAAATGRFQNSAVSSGSPLWFLGDVFAVPQGWPFANVFSVGDVVIAAGLIVLVHRVCRPSPTASVVGRAEPVIASA